MRALSLLVAIVAGLLLPAPAGASTVAETEFSLCWPAPAPGTGWTPLERYDRESCAECEAVGAAGVSNGDWEAFRCGFFTLGIDGIYRLYVPSNQLTDP
jgi:hypothetical protein